MANSFTRTENQWFEGSEKGNIPEFQSLFPTSSPGGFPSFFQGSLKSTAPEVFGAVFLDRIRESTVSLKYNEIVACELLTYFEGER